MGIWYEEHSDNKKPSFAVGLARSLSLEKKHRRSKSSLLKHIGPSTPHAQALRCQRGEPHATCRIELTELFARWSIGGIALGRYPFEPEVDITHLFEVHKPLKDTSCNTLSSAAYQARQGSLVVSKKNYINARSALHGANPEHLARLRKPPAHKSTHLSSQSRRAEDHTGQSIQKTI